MFNGIAGKINKAGTETGVPGGKSERGAGLPGIATPYWQAVATSEHAAIRFVPWYMSPGNAPLQSQQQESAERRGLFI